MRDKCVPWNLPVGKFVDHKGMTDMMNNALMTVTDQPLTGHSFAVLEAGRKLDTETMDSLWFVTLMDKQGTVVSFLSLESLDRNRVELIFSTTALLAAP
ncbi:MAG: hypothetical protein H9W81_13645 [Enterococcus sp.]|nr:hypothetical protein [Enterococcus sp.]